MGRILVISIFEGKYLLQFKQNSGYNDALFTILTDGWMDGCTFLHYSLRQMRWMDPNYNIVIWKPH